MTRRATYKTKAKVLSPRARAAFEKSLAKKPFGEPTPPDPHSARRRALAAAPRATRRYSKDAQETNSFLIGDRDQITYTREFTNSGYERMMRSNRKPVAA